MPDPEMQGAKARDHAHERHHGPAAVRGPATRRLHQDWRVWAAVLLMLALILVYVFSVDLSLWPGRRATPPVPAIGGP